MTTRQGSPTPTAEGQTANGQTASFTNQKEGTTGRLRATVSPFSQIYVPPAPLQHVATHLNFTSSPSLTGELLRQAMSEYLRTQVCYVTQVVVLSGWNSHGLSHTDESISFNDGKLCYACMTQCELILVDRQLIGKLSLSAVAPSYDEIMKSSAPNNSQMIYCIPFHVIDKIHFDADREDYFTLFLTEKPKRGLGFPDAFLCSTVHRKAFIETLRTLYDAHFQFAAMMPDSAHVLNQMAQAALQAHAQVAMQHIYSTQGVSTGSEADSSLDPFLHATSSQFEPDRLIPHHSFHFLTTSSNGTKTLDQIRTLTIQSQKRDNHAAAQFYQKLPSRYRGKILHRCGYMFQTLKPYRSLLGNRVIQEADKEIGEWMEPSELYQNRPTATYTYQTSKDEEKNLPLHQRKFLQVTICKEKPISPFSCVVKSRDLRGQCDGAARAEGKAGLKELLRGRDDCDDDDFFIWAEAIGRAVAMNECKTSGIASDYFIPVSKAYEKKMNVVGDKSSWTCFKVQMFTSTREIGVICCRRKCLPPYFDTYQDLVFVMYGEAKEQKASNAAGLLLLAAAAAAATNGSGTATTSAPITGAAASSPASSSMPASSLMEELEMMVDTLSPTVVPFPFHFIASGGSDPTGSIKPKPFTPSAPMSLLLKDIPPSLIHPTYADVLVLQGRMNSLLFNSMSYHWLASRAWISSLNIFRRSSSIKLPGNDFGIFPTTEFLGQACFRLASSFANSILVRVTHRRERVEWADYLPGIAIEGIGAENVEEEEVSTTAKPEGQTATEGGEKEGENTKGEKQEATTEGATTAATTGSTKIPLVADPMEIVSRMLTEFASAEFMARRKFGPQNTTYSAEEEWRCRVSQYLAYCVDDGIFPGALNIKRLLSVLTRAFLDAPILSAETGFKLDRVVDFLLYMKPRCGIPLELPSWKHADAAVDSVKSQKHHHHKHRHLRSAPAPHKPKAATLEFTNQHSPFASLSNSSPQAMFQELPTNIQQCDYDESTTLLQKLRDDNLIKNFTCNEHIMIPLLDTSYIESLERATIGTAFQRDGSVIPKLLCALLTKDYNIDLIRAVKDKIIAYQIHDPDLIAPLIALMKDGTMQTSQYALQALTTLARYHPQAVIEAGGAAMPMWFIFMSKNELLLSASITLILQLFNDSTRQQFSHPQFALKLVELLGRRVGGARYQHTVLEKTAVLIFQLAKIPELLQIFLSANAHRELVSIIAEDEKRPILLEISACLGQLFTFAKGSMLKITTNLDTMKEDAAIIVQSMAKCTTRHQLRICINLLVALQILIRLPKAFYSRLSNTMTNKSGGVQFTAPVKEFETRILVLQQLHTHEGLENVLDRATASADSESLRCETQLRALNAIEEIPAADGTKPKIKILPVEGDTSDPLSTAARTLEMIKQYTIAKNVIKVSRWFKMRMNFCVTASWNVNIIWQKDNKKTILAVPKE